MFLHPQRFRVEWELRRLRHRMFSKPPLTSGIERCRGYAVCIIDGPDYYIQYKDTFIRQIYHFNASRPDPMVVDGGSNIGMSILYFKHLYPEARVFGFEPDPRIFETLQKNVSNNHLSKVNLINAGLGEKGDQVSFLPDGKSGGHFGQGEKSVMVHVHPLSEYLKEPTDFLKLNVEGAEVLVLEEAAQSGKLINVQEMVLEYHGWPNSKQALGRILTLLDEQGFRYLVHDFDAETCGATKPPFHLEGETKWFCLVYARRLRR